MCCGRKSGEKKHSRAPARSQQTVGPATSTEERMPGGSRRILPGQRTGDLCREISGLHGLRILPFAEMRGRAGFKTLLMLLKKLKIVQEKTAAISIAGILI